MVASPLGGTVPEPRFFYRTALSAAVACTFAASAAAQNAAFQSFFLDVCNNPQGQLAAQCAQTPNGQGGLASNSQDSLNPNQNVTSTDAALARGRALLGETQEELRERRTEEKEEARLQRLGVSAGQDDEGMDFGGFSLLFNVRGEVFDRDREESDNEIGYDGDAVGLEAGFDYRIGERLILGALLGYQHSDSTFDRGESGANFTPQADQGGAESDTYSLTLFGAYSLTDNWYIDGSVSAGITDYEFERRPVFLEVTRTVPQTNVRTKGDTDGTEWSASIGGGYDFYRDAWSFGPYARLNLVRTDIDGYTEDDLNNSGLAMRVDDNDATSLTSVLGVQASYAVSTDFGVVLPQVRAEYEHEFRNDAQTVNTVFVNDAGGTSFGVRGDSPDRNYFNLGASLLFVLPNGVMPFVDVEALLGYEDLERYRLTGGLRLEW